MTAPVQVLGRQSEVPAAVQSAPAAPPATDMGELAVRVRALISLDTAAVVQLPLGGGMVDVVVTADSDAVVTGVLAVLDGLPAGCGPVLHQPRSAEGGGWLYWLVPPGTARTWIQRPQGVCVGEGHTLTVPPPHSPTPHMSGRYWLRRFEHERYVPAQALASLLHQPRVADSAPPQLRALATYLTQQGRT